MSLSARSRVALMSANEVRLPRASRGSSTLKGERKHVHAVEVAGKGGGRQVDKVGQ